MASSDLHKTLRDEIDRQLAIAQAAHDDGGWESLARWLPSLAEYLNLNGPADAIRRYQRDLKTLERHTPVEVHTNIEPRMVACAYEWSDSDGYIVAYEFCPHIKDLADDYLEAVNG